MSSPPRPQRLALRVPVVITMALAMLAGCRSDQAQIAAIRERQSAVMPLRTRLPATLGRDVDVELSANGELTVRWHIGTAVPVADSVAADVRRILATLQATQFDYATLVVEGVVDSDLSSRRDGGKVLARARFDRQSVDRVDWQSGDHHPLEAAEEIMLQGRNSQGRRY